MLQEALDRLPPDDSPLRVRLLARRGVDTYMQAVNQNNLTLSDDLAARIRSDSASAISIARQLADPASSPMLWRCVRCRTGCNRPRTGSLMLRTRSRRDRLVET